MVWLYHIRYTMEVHDELLSCKVVVKAQMMGGMRGSHNDSPEL